MRILTLLLITPAGAFENPLVSHGVKLGRRRRNTDYPHTTVRRPGEADVRTSV